MPPRRAGKAEAEVEEAGGSARAPRRASEAAEEEEEKEEEDPRCAMETEEEKEEGGSAMLAREGGRRARRTPSSGAADDSPRGGRRAATTGDGGGRGPGARGARTTRHRVRSGRSCRGSEQPGPSVAVVVLFRQWRKTDDGRTEDRGGCGADVRGSGEGAASSQ